MLGDDEEEPPPAQLQLQLHVAAAPPLAQMRQLLVSCAEVVGRPDFAEAQRLLSVLSSNCSPCGDSTERLGHQFTRALKLRCSGGFGGFRVSVNGGGSTSRGFSDEDTVVQSSYLSLNQVTPFVRFCQLTANQAILEAIDGHKSIHILDFDIMHGVQWPPLMQALADRYPTPTLRITGTGGELEILRRTGDRLAKFAHSLGLRFQFHPLILLAGEDPVSVIASSVVILPEETLAVNCNHYLHRLLTDRDHLHLFLRRIKSMSPIIVAVAEREANHNHPIFQHRFMEALNHYAAVFDSLEATLPPNSHERFAVEQIWFGKEISDIVAAEGEFRRERHERFRSWDLMMRSSGFSNVQFSPFAVSQAKLLLRLHYPSEGYQLQISNNSLCLGWQNQPLYSVSSWH